MAHLLHRLGAFAVRRRRAVLIGWLVAVAVLGGLTMGLKGTFASEFSIPGTESQQAAQLVAERVPGVNPDAANGRVVFAAPPGESLQTADRKAAVEQSVAALAKVTDIGSATDPFADPTISQDGRIGYSDLGSRSGRWTSRPPRPTPSPPPPSRRRTRACRSSTAAPPRRPLRSRTSARASASSSRCWC